MGKGGVKFYRLTTCREDYGTDKSPKEWADEIKKKLSNYNFVPDDISFIQGDPAMFTKGQDNSISIADQFKSEGIKINPASNDRIGGWENMHNWLSIAPDGLPYWQITENCIHLLETLPSLVHDEIKVEDVDTAGEDHASDDQRYMLKKLKWLGSKVGAMRHPEIRTNISRTASFIGSKQVSVDLDAFTGQKVNESGVGGITH